MLSFSSDALAYIQDKKQPVYLEMPPVIEACMTICEKPDVRLGCPYNPEAYRKQEVQGLTVFVPHDLPDVELTVTLHRFLGIKHLGLEGWHLA